MVAGAGSAGLPIRQALRAERQAAIERFRASHNDYQLLVELRRATDRAIGRLLALYPLPADAALAAVGGYGRGELYPHSDVDLLILLARPADPADEQRIEALVTALWDIGLEIGHSTRTIDECMAEAARDITVETALLEARWLAGARWLFRQFRRRRDLQLDPRAFFRAKQLEMQRRHTKYQDTPYALEPNCKESPGGLRDLQVILWMARAAGYGHSWVEVARNGLLTSQEALELERAEAAFRRLRIELHLLTGRREDRVVFDVQNALAQVYGFEASGGRRASELLMQRYYWAAKLVTQLNTLLVQNIEERLFPRPGESARRIDDDFQVMHDRLDIIDPEAFARKPELLLRAFLRMQQDAALTGMSARTLRAIWHNRHRIDETFRANPSNRRCFIQILQQPRGIVHELRRMNDLSILPHYLPAFRPIVGQMQHDLFHVYTVDQHILMVVRNLRRFTMPEHAHEYPHCSQLMADFDAPWLLYVAALFHDIAKGRGGDHSELGAMDVQAFARDHELSVEDTDLLVFLVRHHLTMSSTAQKQDLADPAVIETFASKVRTPRRLTALYLLTVADVRGTSPKVWNAWKGRLLEELFRRTLRHLGGERADRQTMLESRRQEALRLLRLHGLRDEAREALWATLDVVYFMRHDAADIAWHTRHLHHRVDARDPVVRARPTESDEGLEVMVYCPDAPDLFARICGFFDAQNLSIQDARIHTTRSGHALDTFVVVSDEAITAWRDRIGFIEHQLAQCLSSSELQTASNSPTRGRPSRQSRLFPISPSVHLRPDERGEWWILSVSASDRTGLLHAIALCFARHGVHLHMAKVMTLGERVEDTFLVAGDIFGHPLRQADFERDLLAVLA